MSCALVACGRAVPLLCSLLRWPAGGGTQQQCPLALSRQSRIMHRAVRSGLACWLRGPWEPPASRGLVSSAPMDWLERFVNFERKGVPAAAGTDSAAGFDLGRMHRLLDALGDPQNAWTAVHVTGTKGKGSTGRMVADMLRAARYRVGLYASPHVRDFNERISVDGEPISDAALAALAARWRPAVDAAAEAEGGALSQFEVATALAFAHFAEQQVDVAVVEVGLGGARDATNVFQPQRLGAAVVTAVGRDHAAALGDSVEAIAEAKAGIMKAGRPVVLGAQPEAAAGRVLRAHAERLGCELTYAPDEARLSPMGVRLAPGSGGGLQAQYELRLLGGTAAALVPPGGQAAYDLSLALVGEHQAENAATALGTAAALQRQGFSRLDIDAALAGLAAARLRGRFQVCRLPQDAEAAAAAAAGHGGGRGGEAGGAGLAASPPYVVLDGAHTPESARALARALRSAWPSAPVALVLAMAGDKDHRGLCTELRALKPKAVVFTQVPVAGGSDRSAAPGALAAGWQLSGAASPGGRARELIQASPAGAVARARMELGGEGIVLVCGSMHVVGAVLRQVDLDPT